MNKTEIISHVNKTWNEFVKANPKMVAPMLRGMPKTCAEYLIAFLRKNTHGYTSNDLGYCKRILSIIGVSEECAEIFFESEIKGQY